MLIGNLLLCVLEVIWLVVCVMVLVMVLLRVLSFLLVRVVVFLICVRVVICVDFSFLFEIGKFFMVCCVCVL